VTSSRARHATGAERRAFIRLNEADAAMAQGDLRVAGDMLGEARQVVMQPPPSRWMTWRYSMHCYVSLAELALLRGDADGGRRWADEALSLATPTRSDKYASWAWRLKGESALHRRDWTGADAALGRALTIAETIYHPRQTWLARLALGRLHDANGRREKARKSYVAAARLIQQRRSSTADAALRTGLETWPVIRQIEELAKS
jgi:tetratricopeptide (TPR) repeat protein